MRAKTTTHRHRPRTSRTVCFRGPAPGARRENQAAHGGVTEIEICSCGAERHTNINGAHVEMGAWLD